MTGRDDARSIESPLLLYRRLKRRPAFVCRQRRDPMNACCAQRDLGFGLQTGFEETSDSCSVQLCRDGRRKTGFEYEFLNSKRGVHTKGMDSLGGK
jgi:hypothetical protein